MTTRDFQEKKDAVRIWNARPREDAIARENIALDRQLRTMIGTNKESLEREAKLKAENADLLKQLAEAKEKIKKFEHKTCASCRYEGNPDKCMELQCFGGAWTPKEDGDD